MIVYPKSINLSGYYQLLVLQLGTEAPSFTLPGVRDDQFELFDLQDATAGGNAVLLLFYPCDFSPVCTRELCEFRDAELFQLTPNLEVWAASSDSCYAHRAFSNEYGLNFPLLSDNQGRVADDYGVCLPEWEHHSNVPGRAVFLIDSQQTIRYTWQTNDTSTAPDLFAIHEAVGELDKDRPGSNYLEPSCETGGGHDHSKSE